jgi:hypothetical protein
VQLDWASRSPYRKGLVRFQCILAERNVPTNLFDPFEIDVDHATLLGLAKYGRFYSVVYPGRADD